MALCPDVGGSETSYTIETTAVYWKQCTALDPVNSTPLLWPPSSLFIHVASRLLPRLLPVLTSPLRSIEGVSQERRR